MIWLFLPMVIAAEPAAAASKAADLDARVAAIVEQLADDAYAVRERAQAELEALPAEALPLVSRAYRQTDDAEVRMRLRLYADAYFERQILRRFSEFRRPGFLGVMQQDGQLEDGRGYVEILRVMPGTAAEAAGLKAGDKIIALNDNAMPNVNGTVAVARYVQAHRAGDAMKCTILREGEQVEITAELGGLPDEHLNDEKREQLLEARADLKKQWWERGFLAGDLNFVPQVATETDSDAAVEAAPRK